MIGLDDFFFTVLARVAGFLLFTVLIVGGVAAFHHHIEYWLASLISFCIIFGGILIFEGDWIG